MLFKDLADCDQCPFMTAGVCSGDVSMGPNGPIFPPCEDWDDDVDVDRALAEHRAAREAQVVALVAAERAARQAQAKRALAARRRAFVDRVCSAERAAVKAAERRVREATKLANRAAVLASVDEDKLSELLDE